MRITNTSKTTLDLPGGQRLLPNVPVTVPNWAELLRNPIVSAWHKAGVLRAEPLPAAFVELPVVADPVQQEPDIAEYAEPAPARRRWFGSGDGDAEA